MKVNIENQNYKGIVLRYYGRKTKLAARFVIFDTNQNIWIPRKHLDDDFNIIDNIDYIVFKWQTRHKVKLAKEIINNRK